MSSFHERQKNLFNHLKDAEDQYSFSKSNKAEPQDLETVDKKSYKKLRQTMKQFRGKESIFKRQEANLKDCLRSKTTPDYLKNPQKWVYYSLSDVTPDQMSDYTNTATAIALIQEMEADKIKMEIDTEETGFKKPSFRISSGIKKPCQDEQKPVFKCSKIIMPEYVVGVSKKKEKKNIKKEMSGNTRECDKKIELKLNHLYEDDE